MAFFGFVLVFSLPLFAREISTVVPVTVLADPVCAYLTVQIAKLERNRPFIPRVEKWEWLDGVKPSQAALNNMAMSENVDFPTPGSLVTMMTYDRLPLFSLYGVEKKTGYFSYRDPVAGRETYFRRAEKHHENLLTEGTEGEIAREVSQIRVPAGGDTLVSQTLRGSMHEVAWNVEEKVKAVRAMLDKAKAMGKPASEVRLIHTHPGANFLSRNVYGAIEKSNFTPVNAHDLSIAHKVSARVPDVTIVMEAVMAGGIVSFVKFRNGEPVDGP